jgi:Pentapeptide repeats (8 copies)
VLIWISLVGFGVLVFAASFIYLGYRWSWTGFGQAQLPKDDNWEIRASRSLWDWLGLLVIPVVLTVGGTVGGLLFAYQQNERQQEIDAQQQEIENQRAQLLALEGYLDEIGNLLLDTNTPLRQSHEGDPVQDLARARTLTMLDMLSPERKPRVLEFLFEMELIQTAPPDQKNPIISLRFADLREVYLAQRHLLKSAELVNADMQEANLRRAMLSNTNLRKADFGKAKLVKADLSEADLTEANLRGAKGVSCQHTEQTKSLEDATMPGGQNYEDWLKDKGCGKD